MTKRKTKQGSNGAASNMEADLAAYESGVAVDESVDGLDVAPDDDTATEPDTHTNTFRQLLPVPLTQEQMRERADELVELHEKKREVEEASKASAKRYRDTKAALELELDAAVAQLRDGTEMRTIECRQDKDFARNTITITRLDTNEVVDERAMTGADRQLEIDMPGEAPGDGLKTFKLHWHSSGASLKEGSTMPHMRDETIGGWSYVAAVRAADAEAAKDLVLAEHDDTGDAFEWQSTIEVQVPLADVKAACDEIGGLNDETGMVWPWPEVGALDGVDELALMRDRADASAEGVGEPSEGDVVQTSSAEVRRKRARARRSKQAEAT